MTLDEEFDEIERLENEADILRSDISKLLYKQASAKYDKSIDLTGVSEEIENKREELLKIRTSLDVAKIEMGDEYDRYKANKRK